MEETKEEQEEYEYPCQAGEKCVYLRDTGTVKVCGFGLGCVKNP